MRANRDAAVKLKAYDIGFGDATATTPATVAERDLQDWLARMVATLGAGAQANVQYLGNSIVAVRLRWNDTRGDTLNVQSGGMTATTGTVTFEMRARI
jgi:hypothetical protein